jgi:RES domain-containing protein
MLEILVHVPRDQAPDDLVFVGAEIPDDAIEDLDVASLPQGWGRTPPPVELRAVGDAWIRQTRALALRVPSAIVPQEHNVLINPEHPQFHNLSIGAPEAAVIDPRLIR